MNRVVLWSAAIMMLLGSCSDHPTDEQPQSSDTASVDLSAIRQAEQEQLAAMAAGNADGAVRPYSPSATLVVPGSAPLVGLDAISGAFKAMLGDNAFAYDLTSDETWIAGSGDLAVTTGTFSNTYTEASGKPATIGGHNQTVWQKDGDGNWKIVSDYNVNTSG